MDARQTWLLKDIAAIVGAAIDDVRPFTTPAISDEDAQMLQQTRIGDYSGYKGIPHVTMPVLVATFRAAGWSLRDIGLALGVSRQNVHARYVARGGHPEPNKTILRAISHRPKIGPYAPISVPKYAVDPDDPDAHVPIGIVPDDDIATLGKKMTAYLDDRTPENRKAAVDFARRLIARYKVSYPQLSVATGVSTSKYTLSRMALHEGEDVYVPRMSPRRLAG